MTAKITLDKAGRVVIPRTLRRELRLGPGDALQLESEGDRITLRPFRAEALLKKERGVWGLSERTDACDSQLDRPGTGKHLRDVVG